jgi:hypothetical protein
MSETQSRDRRQRVENIAHCAQTDNEQAEVGLRVQRTIFAQRDQRSAFSFRLTVLSFQLQLSAPFTASEMR